MTVGIAEINAPGDAVVDGEGDRHVPFLEFPICRSQFVLAA